MAAFWIVWVGQLVSLLGTGMTNFAITIWAFQITGRATDLALIMVFFQVPLLIISPFVGVWVDKFDRKLMMMLSDLAAGIVTIIMFTLYSLDLLQVWHLFIAASINGLFQAFQWPAYSAALSVMIPKEQYVRANSMLEIAGPGSNILAPALAGAVIGGAVAVGLDGIALVFMIDIVTFTAAIGTLLFVYIPNPDRTADAAKVEGQNILRQAAYGFQYIFERPPLLAVQTVFLVGNLFSMMGIAVLAPMILARSGSSEIILGTVQSIIAVGAVVGGLIVGAWGGFQRRIYGVLIGWIITFMGSVVVALGRPDGLWIIFWYLGAFFFFFSAPLINGSNQAIWQSKIPPDLQGRVFSARRLIAWLATPIAGLIAGPLADFVLEPAMQPGGALSPIFGAVLGTGPGAGMALLMLITAMFGILVGVVGLTLPLVRNVEDLLPDHGQDAKAPPPAEEQVETAPEPAVS
ncbi:MAG: MFS transporter [Chloroflexi bacterium]|nr:MFS transporter [Chloroflexota bacterium]